MPQLPTGNVTFLFTDIEGSTQLWESYPQAMNVALARHDALLRTAIESNHGVVFKTVGDAFCCVFTNPQDAVIGALAAQQALMQEWSAPEVEAPLLNDTQETKRENISSSDKGLNSNAVSANMPRSANINIRVRMALHTGVSEERDSDYFGPTLNRVARLQSAGHGQQILLSQATYDHLYQQLPLQTYLRDWGQHRLKDLTAPEHIWQLLHPDLPTDFPPLKTLDTLRNNLEQQITRFIGRKQELADVKQLLASNPIVTLIGAGGTGKTRLALQVSADTLDDYSDGVWMVELAALNDPSLLPQAVAAVLHIREEPNRSLTHTLIDHLRKQRVLLLLDNCEHLLDACARFADALLHYCPSVRLLITTRESLNLNGEILYRVPPLRMPETQNIPSPEELWDYDACCFLLERVRQQRPDWLLTSQNTLAVVRICQQLDGIPLALELAAARVSSLSLEQIAQRLDDRFRLLTRGHRMALPRQQTLRAMVDWSYDLLSEQERRLFRRLSVFAGSFSLPMAEAICTDTTISKREVLDLISRLVDKSLVLFEETGGERCYRLLETLRQYGCDILEDALETSAVRSRHRDYFLLLALEAEPQLQGKAQESWFVRLEIERDNLRSALDWCLADYADTQNLSHEAKRERAEKWLKLASALERFWFVRGPISEGRNRLEQTLQVSHEAGKLVRANALNSIGILAAAQGDNEAANQYHLECLALQRSLNNRIGIARSLNNLSVAADMRGDYKTMQHYLEEGSEIYRELQNFLSYAATLLNLGVATSKQENYLSAQSYYEESLIILRQLEHKLYLGYVLCNLGDVMLRQNNLEKAQNYLHESAEIRKGLGDTLGLVQVLEHLAMLAVRQQRYVSAAHWLAAAEGVREQEGFSYSYSEVQDFAHDKEITRAQLGDATFHCAWTQGKQMKLMEAVDEALQDNHD